MTTDKGQLYQIYLYGAVNDHSGVMKYKKN